MEQDSEFYIGWQATAPPSFAQVVRYFVIGAGLLVVVLAICLVYFQQGFSNGTFEYGKMVELEGVYSEKPVPFLTIDNGKDAGGNVVFQKILLVGPGKFGFHTGAQKVEEGATIKAAGFLIYNDGKTAFQVESIIPVIGATQNSATRSQSGTLPVTLRGEITDPKCLLGVMNPGQGKPHRDCAIRCIAGGLPPVLKVANEAGDTEYYLLVGPDGEPINNRLLDFVGDGVQLCGRLEQQADWWVLYADPNTLQRINKGALNPGPMCQ